MNQQISPPPDNVESSNHFERERFALERAQVEFQQQLERDRFEFEKTKASVDEKRLELEAEKAKLERRLLNKHLGTVITAIVSLAAVLVTVAQVVTAIVSKDKELQMMQAQKKEEMAMLQQQHQNEIQLLVKRQDQEWNLSTAKFFAENDRKIFSRDQRQRDSMLRVMILTFPASVIEAISQKDPQIAASINRARKASQDTSVVTRDVVTSSDPFGRQVRWQPTGDRSVTFVDNWDKENIVSVTIPQLNGIPGLKSAGKIRFHKDAASSLKAAFAEIESRDLLHLVKTWDGGYAPITIRGAKRISKHGLGVAFDLNVAFNPPGRPPAPAGAEGSLAELAPIFEKHGFKWGGNFARPDPNHFEYAAPQPATATPSP